MPEQTLRDAIAELHEVVLALHELVERNRRKARKRWLVILAILPVIFVSSFFATVTTVSVCFLQDRGLPGPSVCKIIPGYPEMIETNTGRIKKFEELIETTERNDERLDRLERKARR